MTVSKNTSAPEATAQTNGSTHRSANPPSPVADGFSLSGRSNRPDPLTHAYRKDLADTALAGRVIASHYAEPLVRHLVASAELRAAPDSAADVLSVLEAGSELRMLDNSRGWAWGYGPDGRVGYVPSSAVGI